MNINNIVVETGKKVKNNIKSVLLAVALVLSAGSITLSVVAISKKPAQKSEPLTTIVEQLPAKLVERAENRFTNQYTYIIQKTNNKNEYCITYYVIVGAVSERRFFQEYIVFDEITNEIKIIKIL